MDALSQAAARVVFANRATFEPGIAAIIEERERLMRGLLTLPGVTPFPSDANYILFRMEGADAAWAFLYERGVLVRDFSHAPLLEGCLRVTVGTPEQNDGFLAALRDFIMGRCEAR